MLTCKDCVHYDTCTIMEHSSYDPAYLQEFGCGDFKNKADFVEVVRCKDCTEWKRNGGFVDSPNGHCFYHGIDTNGHDYCSYGEKNGENSLLYADLEEIIDATN